MQELSVVWSLCGRPPGGCRLRDVVQGDMKWVLASNYMVDMSWLLSACPHLLQAQQLVVVHGERTPDRCQQPLPCAHHGIARLWACRARSLAYAPLAGC